MTATAGGEREDGGGSSVGGGVVIGTKGVAQKTQAERLPGDHGIHRRKFGAFEHLHLGPAFPLPGIMRGVAVRSVENAKRDIRIQTGMVAEADALPDVEGLVLPIEL